MKKLSLKKLKYHKNRESIYSVKIDMLNNSDSIVGFWTMTCWWQINWCSYNKWLYLHNPGCDHNGPIFRQILPNEKLTYEGLLCVSDSLQERNSVRIGFIFVPKSDISEDWGSDFTQILFHKREKHKDIIWSEPFKIE